MQRALKLRMLRVFKFYSAIRYNKWVINIWLDRGLVSIATINGSRITTGVTKKHKEILLKLNLTP